MMLFISYLHGQAGMNVYGGISTMQSVDKNFTPEKEMHSGYVVGVHARLNSDDLYFLFSGDYGSMDLVSKPNYNLDLKDNLSYFKFKAGLGLDFLHFKNKIGLRTKAQGALMMINKYDEEQLINSNLPKEYKVLNDGSAGIATSLGVFIGPLTADISYEIGIINFVKEIKTTKLNFLDFTVGLRF